MRIPKPYAEFVQRLRVPAGFVILAAFILLSQPTWQSLAFGLPVCLPGLWLRGWAAGHLAKNQQLAQSGPYGHLRNPLYLGSLFMACGMALAANHRLLVALFAAAFALIYLPVIQQEEDKLRELFPNYDEYARRVPSLLPRLSFAGCAAPFQWELYKRNQEWKALSGWLLGVIVLVVKVFARE